MRLWLRPRAVLHSTCGLMRCAPKHGERPCSRQAEAVAPRPGSQTLWNNDEHRLTQNRHWDLPTTDAMRSFLIYGATARARVELAYKTSPHLLTKDNANPSETMA